MRRFVRAAVVVLAFVCMATKPSVEASLNNYVDNFKLEDFLNFVNKTKVHMRTN